MRNPVLSGANRNLHQMTARVSGAFRLKKVIKTKNIKIMLDSWQRVSIIHG